MEQHGRLEAGAQRDDARPTLELDGWDGPSDLLLMLAPAQKVDQREIQILALTEQYLQFLAEAKALRLQRLDAMCETGARLMARDRIGRDVQPRGALEGLRVVRSSAWELDLYGSITAYGCVQARMILAVHVVRQRPVMTLEQALERAEGMIGMRIGWASIESFLPQTSDPPYRSSALASSRQPSRPPVSRISGRPACSIRWKRRLGQTRL